MKFTLIMVFMIYSGLIQAASMAAHVNFITNVDRQYIRVLQEDFGRASDLKSSRNFAYRQIPSGKLNFLLGIEPTMLGDGECGIYFAAYTLVYPIYTKASSEKMKLRSKNERNERVNAIAREASNIMQKQINNWMECKTSELSDDAPEIEQHFDIKGLERRFEAVKREIKQL